MLCEPEHLPTNIVEACPLGLTEVSTKATFEPDDESLTQSRGTIPGDTTASPATVLV